MKRRYRYTVNRCECKYWKRKDGYIIKIEKGMVLDDEERVIRLVHYYAEKMGHKMKKITSNRWLISNDRILGLRAAWKYIDENGEDTDDEIAEWMETAKNW